jgi:hypothetical protein
MPTPRINLSFPTPQLAWLKAEARRAGVSIPEILRRLVEAARNANPRK